MISYPKIIATLAITILLSMSILPSLAEARAGGGSRGGSSRSFGGSRMTSPNIGKAPRTYAPSNRNSYTPPARPAAPYTQTPSLSQPSFFQRHPFLTSFGAAMAGSWIGNMLFGGHNKATAANTASSTSDPSDTNALDTTPPTSGSGTINFLTIFIILIGGFFVFKLLKRKNGVPTSSAWSGYSQQPSFDRPQPLTLDPEDEQEFASLLVDVQTAWSNQDFNSLKKLCTPEVMTYFSTILNQNAQQGIENRVTDLDVTGVEIQDAWVEGGTEYASVLLRWQAKDYTVNPHLQPYESGYIIEGDPDQLQESTELWTYSRHSSGAKWILAGITQV